MDLETEHIQTGIQGEKTEKYKPFSEEFKVLARRMADASIEKNESLIAVIYEKALRLGMTELEEKTLKSIQKTGDASSHLSDKNLTEIRESLPK